MSLKPEVGLVIRYDFLWKSEEEAGREDGKDRPCAIILMSEKKADNSHTVVVCPITHSPPQQGESAIEIPYKVARHLRLDDDRMWIKTHEVNQFIWEEGRIPYGVTPTTDDRWSYGMLPEALGRKAHQQIAENAQQHSLAVVKRDNEAEAG